MRTPKGNFAARSTVRERAAYMFQLEYLWLGHQCKEKILKTNATWILTACLHPFFEL